MRSSASRRLFRAPAKENHPRYGLGSTTQVVPRAVEYQLLFLYLARQLVLLRHKRCRSGLLANYPECRDIVVVLGKGVWGNISHTMHWFNVNYDFFMLIMTFLC